MPTMESQTTLRDPHQIPFDIISSQEEDADYGSNGSLSRAVENVKEKIRKARFLFSVWQSFVTETTSTSWFVTSITSTKTYSGGKL